MKTFFLFLSVLVASGLWAQKTISPTDSILIMGEVTAPAVIRLADAQKLKEIIIGDLTLINARNEKKNTAKGLRGVRLKEVIQAAVRFNAGTPSELSRFYFTLVASDGFTALYSWSELFNSPTGESTFLITAKDGKTMALHPERLLTLTTTDYQTGRRYVKGLQTIIVSRVR